MLLVVLTLASSWTFSQTKTGSLSNPVVTSTDRVYQKVNFTTATAETTNYISVRDMGEWGLIYEATDSVGVDFVVTGRNSVVQAITTTFADSLVGTSNTSNTASRVFKSETVNTFPNEDQIKISVIARGSGQGTTSGRALKIWMYYKKP